MFIKLRTGMGGHSHLPNSPCFIFYGTTFLKLSNRLTNKKIDFSFQIFKIALISAVC